jgi:hypothetical protein
MASQVARGASLKFQNVLVVIKQTAFEEYSQVCVYVNVVKVRVCVVCML